MFLQARQRSFAKRDSKQHLHVSKMKLAFWKWMSACCVDIVTWLNHFLGHADSLERQCKAAEVLITDMRKTTALVLQISLQHWCRTEPFWPGKVNTMDCLGQAYWCSWCLWFYSALLFYLSYHYYGRGWDCLITLNLKISEKAIFLSFHVCHVCHLPYLHPLFFWLQQDEVTGPQTKTSR